MRRPFRYRLIFIRHGETEWNREGRLQGQRDIPINPRGRDQAAAAGRLVRQWLGARTDRILDETDFWASPLSRTRETMDLALVGMGRPRQSYVMDSELVELSFGEWEGLTWADIKPRDPGAIRTRRADKWGFVPPGGESSAMPADRIGRWLDKVTGDALIVSHGGVARVMLHLLAGVEPREAVDMEIYQGRVLVLDGGTARWV